MSGLYVQLDTNWPDNPKVIAVGLDGAGLHASALCIAKRLMTDGVLYRAQLLRIGGTDELIDRLVSVGLLEAVDADRVCVHDWLDRNPSRGAIARRVGARQEDGKRGNHKRWRHPGRFEDCPRCNPSVIGSAIGEGSGERVGGRSPRLARDKDKGIDNGDYVAATVAKAEANTAAIKAMHAEPSPVPKITEDGLSASRDAWSSGRAAAQGFLEAVQRTSHLGQED